MPVALCGVVLAVGLPAQEPPSAPPQPPQEVPPQEGEPQPLDPASAAAEILRKRLGLKPGPEGEPPKGPTAPKSTDGSSAEPSVVEPGGGTTPARSPDAAATSPEAASQEPSAQEPNPSQQPAPPGEPLDPSDAARRALQRLLPNATPPGSAPIADEHGTPEPAPAPRHAGGESPDRVWSGQDVAETTPFSGTLAMRYRARHGAGGEDQDLVGRLNADLGRSGVDPVSLHVSGRGFANLDGRRDEVPFSGLDHSFGESLNLRLYTAHLDLARLPGLGLVRLGRQYQDETPTPLSFDGLRADSLRFGGRLDLWVSAYGGVPVHQFEVRRDGDLLVGGAAGLRPWQGGRVRVDALYLRDEFLAIDRQDTLVSAHWWQDLGVVHLDGLHSLRDGQARDLVLNARGDLEHVGQFRVGYRELLSTQRQQVTEIDPYYSIGLEYAPYRQLQLSLTRDLGNGLTAALGVDVRRLRDAGAERAFNREFEQYHLDLAVAELFGVRGLSASVVGSIWDSSGESMRTLTGELQYRPDQATRAALGAGYDLFRYDVIDDRERVHVQSYYLRLDHRFGARLRVDAGYELQTDDVDDFHLFRLGVTWTL